MKVYSVEIASTGALDDGFIDPKTTQDYSDFNAEAGEVADYESKAKGWIRWRNLIEKLSEMHVINDVMDIEIPGASSLVAPTSIKFCLTYDGEPSVRLADDSILYGEDAVKEMISFVLKHDYDMLAMVWNPTVVKQGEKDLMPKGAEFKFVKAPKLFSGIAAKNAVTVKTFDVPNPTDVSLKLSVTPPPPQSKVIINGVETTEYRGNIGDEITWSASADHFISQNGELELEQDTEINVELVEVPGTVIINPTPADAIVKINNMERKSYTGRYGENVTWEVSKVGYKPKSGSLTITEDEVTIPVELEITRVSLTINPTPADAVVTINGNTQKTITVDYGTKVDWVVSKTGYVSQNGSITPTENTTKDVALVLEKHTFSIVATPSDATVIINSEERSTFTADYGTEINWSVGKEGYVSKEGTYILTADKEEVVALDKQQITITVAATPEDATVKLNGAVRKSVTVDYGTEVTYEVSKTGYVSKSGTVSAINTETITIELVKQKVTLTIVPTPEDAVVKINGIEQNTITVDYGTEVTYEVSKTGYVSKTATISVVNTETLSVNLSNEQVTITITIAPTPEDATVKLNGVTQKSITVDYGTQVTYEVSKTGYVSKSGNIIADETQTLPVELAKQQVTLTIVPTPADATVKIDGEVKSEVTVDYGTEISYEVSKTGYVSKSGTETVTATKTLPVVLEVQKVTFAITPTPNDATVLINGTAQTSVSVDYGSEVSWEVSKLGYTTRNGTEVVNKDTTIAIELVIKQFTFTITPTPEDATVTINGVVQSSLTANYGTAITWSVAKDGFTAQNGSLTLTEDTTLPVTLVGSAAIKQVEATPITTFVLYDNGELYGCGSNENGQQGDGGITTNVLSFTKRADNVEKIYTSRSTTFYLTTTGELYGCGHNAEGEQGNGTYTNVLSFTKRAENVKDVSCSTTCTFYLTTTGELYGCGYNREGEQGDGTTTNVLSFTKRADNVEKIYTSSNTTFYLTTTGELYGCGYNALGQQGDGTTTNVLSFTKRAENVKDVSCSPYTTFYLTTTGELYGCGNNMYGQQGDGTTINVSSFTKRADNVEKIYTSNYTTFYLTTTGELYGCGYNEYGQQGDGTTTDVNTFTKRAGNVKDVSCSTNCTFYLTTTGELYGCGYNGNGQQGDGTTTDVLSFTKRAENVKDVSCSGNTSFYLTTTDELYGCGNNGNGQQGDGTTTDVNTFTKKVVK